MKGAFYVFEQTEIYFGFFDSCHTVYSCERSCDVTLTADSYTGSIIAGLYSADGKLEFLNVYPASDTLKVSFDKEQTGNYIKIMWWEDIDSMKSVCGAKTVPLQ